MQWRKVPKESSILPKTGDYKSWKSLLAEEGFHQCIYCAIHDASFGGIRNFHVEHYRPKSRYPELENEFTNLFYACPVCNTFKGNDWPADPPDDCSIQCFPNPSSHDFNELFENDQASGLIQGTTIASKYMVEKLYLNRAQLVMERRLHNLLARGAILRRSIREILSRLPTIPDQEANQLKDRYIRILDQMHELRDRLFQITPYEMKDIQR